MAGGARTAYSMSAAASGKTGIGAAVAGASGVARVGVNSAASGASKLASRAFSGPSESHKSGARAAFTATGGTGAPAPGPSTADAAPDTAPDWARHIGRSQKVREAGMVAISTVRDGDRPGSGASPHLKQDEDA